MAGVSFTGGTEQLADLIRQFETLGHDGLRHVSNVMAATAITQVLLGFERSKDPYGISWAPVKRKGQPLLDTGRLRNSITKKATAKGFRIGTNLVYARIHQFGGTVHHAARANAHAKSGRFLSQASAAKRKTAVRVSFSRAHQGTIKARPFLPDSRGLPPEWEKDLVAAVERTMSFIFRGT